MTVWAARSTGVLFGKVTDKDTSEETLESIFWNSSYVLMTHTACLLLMLPPCISEDKTAAFNEEPDKIAMLKKIEEVPETDAEKVCYTIISDLHYLSEWGSLGCSMCSGDDFHGCHVG